MAWGQGFCSPDLTAVLEIQKLAPHHPVMAENITVLPQIPSKRVGVKAMANGGVWRVGAGENAAFGVVLVEGKNAR